MGRLQGKRALVTGSGIGIGQGIAYELAKEGAAVAVHYSRSAAGANKCMQDILEDGGQAITIQGDLLQVENCLKIVQQSAEAFGGLDILVNNAGITESKSILDVDLQTFEKIVNINFRSQYFTCQEAVRWMQKQGGGSIVNISSIHAFAGCPNNSVYAATKGAIMAFTRELAIELIPLKIRVNCVAPGHVEVPRHWKMTHYSREYGENMVPWGRVGTPQDIGKAVAFLVSDDADYILGQVLYVDGGTTTKLNIGPSAIKKEKD